MVKNFVSKKKLRQQETFFEVEKKENKMKNLDELDKIWTWGNDEEVVYEGENYNEILCCSNSSLETFDKGEFADRYFKNYFSHVKELVSEAPQHEEDDGSYDREFEKSLLESRWCMREFIEIFKNYASKTTQDLMDKDLKELDNFILKMQAADKS